MRFGYFDNNKKEYVITSPNTPAPWINYLGTQNYCAIISNNAGGYSFYKSPKSGRLLRYRFNSIPMDRPGRYVYLRDDEDGDFWSISWQPVGKDLSKFKSICRHGLGYTIFESEYKGIKAELTLFVPTDKDLEVWAVKIKNNSHKKRELSIFSYAEFCFWDIMQDLINFQYILYTCMMDYQDDVVDYTVKFVTHNSPKAFLASTFKVESFDTERDKFIGNYNDESKPLAVVNGKCSNSIAVGGNPCGATQSKLILEPGKEINGAYIVGVGDAKTIGKKVKEYYSNFDNVLKDLSNVYEYWNNRLSKFTFKTQNELFNTMANIWNQYQTHITFNWSRSASFIEAGGRDGLGFRDTNQDILSVIHSIPNESKTRIKELLRAQLSEGYAMHGVQPLTWKQGRHNIPDDPRHIFSDDHLWLILSVTSYLKETGDIDFLEETVEYADEGSDTVYNHLKAALEFSWRKLGPHGITLGLNADWNDCINLKGKGESVWSSMLYHKALVEFIRLANFLNKTEDAEHFEIYRKTIKENLDKYAWDGEWFVRGYLDSGKKLGSKDSEQSIIFLNSQTWSVISEAYLNDDRAVKAMDSVAKYLASEHGVVKNYPAFTKYNEEIGAVTSFPPALKENASIFSHTNTWVVIAEAMLGRGDKAFEYYLSYLPAAKNEIADKYYIEPYVYCQFITGKEHPFEFGRGRNPWLTGTASWAFVGLSQYIIGIRPDYDGIFIDPCIPKDWTEFEVSRYYRDKLLNIKFQNLNKVNKGVKKIIINDTEINGIKIPYEMLHNVNDINVIMG
ncbi:GH36-type glycosyl hydrolase domain-containing protein [Caldicellulosiruptoraceae bacterium PP1]